MQKEEAQVDFQKIRWFCIVCTRGVIQHQLQAVGLPPNTATKNPRRATVLQKVPVNRLLICDKDRKVNGQFSDASLPVAVFCGQSWQILWCSWWPRHWEAYQNRTCGGCVGLANPQVSQTCHVQPQWRPWSHTEVLWLKWSPQRSLWAWLKKEMARTCSLSKCLLYILNKVERHIQGVIGLHFLHQRLQALLWHGAIYVMILMWC